MHYTLAIDQGTHASRGCLFDEAGALVYASEKTIALNRLDSTHIEQDANEIAQSVKTVINDVTNTLSPADTITACGIAVQRSSVVAWKADGTAISPVLSWQDTRAASQLTQLRQFEKEIKQISGLPLSAHYGASKLHYLHNELTNEPQRLSPLISYVLFHILQEQPYIVDHTNAQRTQLFSLADINWSTQLADLFEVEIESLPQCVPVFAANSSPHGHIIGTDIPVRAICGDQNAAIYGAGHLKPETALINIGSGAFLLNLLDHYEVSDEQITGIAYSDSQSVRYVREATINGAGNALTWLEKKHDTSELWRRLPVWLDDIEQPPVFINTIGGLGSPWWKNDIKPEFISQDKSSTKTQTDLASQAVAIIESIVFMICINLKLMQSDQTITCLQVSGGLSQLDGLCQRLADTSGLTVEQLELPEATARGVAWLAAGQPKNWAAPKSKTFKSINNPALAARYDFFSETLSDLTT